MKLVSAPKEKLHVFAFLLLILLFVLFLRVAESVEPELDFSAGESNATTFSNATSRRSKEDSSADMIDRALEKEFNETYQNDAADPGSFNNSVAGEQVVLETVARVKSRKNDTKDEKSFHIHDVFNLDSENRAEDTPTLIDKKDNVFIMSKPKSKYPVLPLDFRLISDLVVVIVSSTCGGIAFACAGQPVITGYLLAGSVIGPGGLSFISEMVQLHLIAYVDAFSHQFSVIFVLFALGLEFSTTKIRIVRAVAILGSLIQIFLFMCLARITAALCGGKSSEGVFIGAFLSMSSTAVVLKFLMERNSVSALHGQVTIGTHPTVGLLFALLPILGGTSGVFQGAGDADYIFGHLDYIISYLCTWFMKLMISLSSQTNELYQLASVAFCLLVAWPLNADGNCHQPMNVKDLCVVLSRNTFFRVEPIRNFFAALFLASIGMLIHVHFLWSHVDILLAAVILVIVVKTAVVATVVKGFGYNDKTSFLVGMSLAQIGEYAFVLLSRASNLHLVEVTTPLLFKLIPAVIHLGVLLRWFPPYNPSEIGYKGGSSRADSAKRVTLMVHGSHDS